jgi:hypothetical protein
MRYLRFVVARTNEDSGVREGLFQAAGRLSRAANLTTFEQTQLETIVQWFSKNLNKPTRFTRTRNASHKRTRGLAWFKDTASEHLRRIREATLVFEEQGIVVECIETDKPGYVVYEDEFQVVAEPFADTGA